MNAVECAYPVSEDIALGMMYAGANTLAIAMTFIGQIILEAPLDSTGPDPLYPFALWTVCTMTIGLVPVLYYDGKYLRLDQDLKALLIPDDSEHNETSTNPFD
jgi:hypothetical protein